MLCLICNTPKAEQFHLFLGGNLIKTDERGKHVLQHTCDRHWWDILQDEQTDHVMLLRMTNLCALFPYQMSVLHLPQSPVHIWFVLFCAADHLSCGNLTEQLVPLFLQFAFVSCPTSSLSSHFWMSLPSWHCHMPEEPIQANCSGNILGIWETCRKMIFYI